jgi:hypothetical protein
MLGLLIASGATRFAQRQTSAHRRTDLVPGYISFGDRCGRGVGCALVDEVVAWTEAQELASITLTTFRDVPWNGPYYEKLGFHVVSTLTPVLQALVDEQETWGLDPSLRVVVRRSLQDQSPLARSPTVRACPDGPV